MLCSPRKTDTDELNVLKNVGTVAVKLLQVTFTVPVEMIRMIYLHVCRSI